MLSKKTPNKTEKKKPKKIVHQTSKRRKRIVIFGPFVNSYFIHNPIYRTRSFIGPKLIGPNVTPAKRCTCRVVGQATKYLP